MKIYTNINENIPKNCVASIGFFDGVHKGHKYILDQLQAKAQERGVEELLISLWPHPSVLFNRPIQLLSTYQEKIDLFQTLGLQNLIFLEFNHETANMSRNEFTQKILIDRLGVSELVMGYNNSFGNKGVEQNQEIGIPVKKLDKITINNKDVNSSILRNLIKEGNVSEAEKLLGYYYQLRGKIVSGYQIGRKIGFPTGNISEIDKMKLVPSNGVYICEVELDSIWHPAMLNIGTRPSFNGSERSIEFHIPDFEADLYDKEIKIRFRKRLRDEKKFDNIDNLIAQLNKDREQTIKFFE